MNNKIKELLAKAAMREDGDWALYFGELIVRECIAVTDVTGGRNVFSERLKEYFDLKDDPIKVGDRVKVIFGFSVGSHGIVNYVEPSGRMWVRRDGASSDTCYIPGELVGSFD